MIKQLLIILTLLLTVSNVSAAEPPTPDDWVCTVTDGDTRLGSWYVRDNMLWPDWWSSMDKYEFVIDHLPFGNDDRPMQFRSCSLLVERAALDPDNADLQAKADVAAFTAGLKARTDKDLWTGVYVGGIDTLRAVEGDTPQSWYEKALAELKPYLDGNPDAMYFDATQGPKVPDAIHNAIVWGHGKGAYLLFNEIQRRGIEVVIEPNTFEDYPLLHEVSVLLTDQWWYGRQYRADYRKQMGFPGGGDSLWDTGTFAARPLHPAHKHDRVYRLVWHQSKISGDYERWIRLARRDGHIPCVRFLDVHYGKVNVDLKD